MRWKEFKLAPFGLKFFCVFGNSGHPFSKYPSIDLHVPIVKFFLRATENFDSFALGLGVLPHHKIMHWSVVGHPCLAKEMCLISQLLSPLFLLLFFLKPNFLNQRKRGRAIQYCCYNRIQGKTSNWPAFTVGSLCKACAAALIKADMKPSLTPCFFKNASLCFCRISDTLLQEKWKENKEI